MQFDGEIVGLLYETEHNSNFAIFLASPEGCLGICSRFAFKPSCLNLHNRLEWCLDKSDRILASLLPKRFD